MQSNPSKKATLDENGNDDYEPIMCFVDNGGKPNEMLEESDEDEDAGNRTADNIILASNSSKAPMILHMSASVERPT